MLDLPNEPKRTSTSHFHLTKLGCIEIERWKDRAGYHLASWLDVKGEKERLVLLDYNLDDDKILKVSIIIALYKLGLNIINDDEYYKSKGCYYISNKYYEVYNSITIQIARGDNGNKTRVYLYDYENERYMLCVATFKNSIKDEDIYDDIYDDLDNMDEVYQYELEKIKKCQS